MKKWHLLPFPCDGFIAPAICYFSPAVHGKAAATAHGERLLWRQQQLLMDDGGFFRSQNTVLLGFIFRGVRGVSAPCSVPTRCSDWLWDGGATVFILHSTAGRGLTGLRAGQPRAEFWLCHLQAL